MGKEEKKEQRRTTKGLSEVAKALKALSGISALLTKNLRRSGKHLRSLMDFDQINRLNAPLKGEKKRSSRRRARRRSSSRRGRRSTTAQRKKNGWNLNGLLKGLKGLGKLLGEVWKRLAKFFRNQKWSVPKNFDRLAAAAKKLGAQLKGALAWGYERILKPLGKWTMEKAVPALVEALAKGLEMVSKVLEILAPIGKAVWDHFLEPLASFAGDVVVAMLKGIGGAFELVTGVLTGVQSAGEGLGKLWDGLKDKAAGLAEGIGSLFQFDPLGWLAEHVTKPLSEFEPLVTLKLALSEGPKDLWKSFCEMWAKNPAVKTVVELAQSGWKSVSEWVKEHIGGAVSKAIGLARDSWKSVSEWVKDYIGGGVSKAIGLARDSWSSVAGWVKDHIGGGVNKAIGLARDGWKSVSEWVKNYIGGGVSKAIGLARDSWSSVAGWVKDHIGGGVNKAIGLARDGWTSVTGWVKDRLGSGISVAVKLAKSWKGSVAKNLGLDKLWTKFRIKLPKISVSWSGTPIKTPHFSVRWNARGGILQGAQLFGLAGNTLLGGGERGREAVLPLESHTGWMDRLADRVAARVGGGAGSGAPIVVKVELDGRVVAESTIREWRSQMRQGRYPLSELV